MTESSNTFILCIGSNTARRGHNLDDACRSIAALARDIRISCTYEMPSYSGIGDAYLNCVLYGVTDLTLEEFEEHTKRLEAVAGRTCQSKGIGVMPLDIDVVVWRGRIIRPDEYDRPYFQLGLKDLQN